uniref:Signal recognition particle 19 kDa protein n=1 Tax=Hucho hucho TaxID=62062 RepID=A0A4W5M049_9TELE
FHLCLPHQAVENPTCAEIRDVLIVGGANVLMEVMNRDVMFRGRVRVQLKQEDGTLCSDKFASLEYVMMYCAEMISKLKTQTQKGAVTFLQMYKIKKVDHFYISIQTLYKHLWQRLQP